MRLAIIPPIAYLKDFSTNYHLVLAQLYKSSEPYRLFYRECKKKGDFIIMDNGAAENGQSIDSEDLYLLALELRPNVLVCPDVLRDADKTMVTTNRFLDAHAKSLIDHRIQLMAVPQGSTRKEWYDNFVWFDADPDVRWLGISKYVAGAFPTRLDALELIKHSVSKKCHLLGMADDVNVIKEEKKFKFVRSTDTAVPVKLGMQLKSLEEYKERVVIKDEEYFGWEALSTEQIDKIEENVQGYKELCR